MKALPFFGALATAFGAIFSFSRLVQTLNGTIPIHTEFIDSVVDRIFWAALLGGCGMVYSVFTFCLYKGISPFERKLALRITVISVGIVFGAGICYHAIMYAGIPWYW